MGPVRRNSASSFTGSTSSKPYVKTASERLRGSTSASAPVPCDSDEDVQILEDLGLPGSRKGKKPATPGQGPSERESKPQRPVSSGSSDTNRPKPESKGKDLKDETKKQSAAAEQTTSSSTMVDYYKVLELQKSASAAEIKKSYRRLALRWHPDKNPDNQQEATVKFRELSEAYEVLIDEKKRKIYDQYGKEGLLNAGRPSGAGHHHRSRGGDHHGAAFADFDSFFGAPFGFGFPGAGFAFRDPEEVFKEFFRSDPMFDLMDDMFASDPFFGSRNRNNRGQRTSGGVSRQQNSLANPFFSPMGFGLGGPMGLSNFFNVHESLAAGGGGGGSEFFSTTTFGVGPGGQNAPNVKRTSTSTRVSNGKKIVTKKVIENGIETVTITENGVLKTKTVNGVPQAIAF